MQPSCEIPVVLNKGEIIINNVSSNSGNSSITEAHVPSVSVDVVTATINSATNVNSAAATGVHSASMQETKTDPLTTALAAYAPALVALTTNGSGLWVDKPPQKFAKALVAVPVVLVHWHWWIPAATSAPCL
jgi:hypothetical protein